MILLENREKIRRKGRLLGQKKSRREASKDEQESIDESEASQNEELFILECIEAQQ
jgi:hypothetical protein